MFGNISERNRTQIEIESHVFHLEFQVYLDICFELQAGVRSAFDL